MDIVYVRGEKNNFYNFWFQKFSNVLKYNLEKLTHYLQVVGLFNCVLIETYNGKFALAIYDISFNTLILIGIVFFFLQKVNVGLL